MNGAIPPLPPMTMACKVTTLVYFTLLSCVTTPSGRIDKHILLFFCFVDRASRYNRVQKNQLDAKLILGIVCQPLHVSGVS